MPATFRQEGVIARAITWHPPVSITLSRFPPLFTNRNPIHPLDPSNPGRAA
jgi:hypothetical protein